MGYSDILGLFNITGNEAKILLYNCTIVLLGTTAANSVIGQVILPINVINLISKYNVHNK